jgi:competence protein ComEA
MAVAILLISAVLFASAGETSAAELRTFTNAVLVNRTNNDGDSFRVKAGKKEFTVRLYFVDCPETLTTTDADIRRIEEQTLYFGLSNRADTISFGKEARDFVKTGLAAPFTVYTAFADAMGRSSDKRYYAFVVTSNGNDLASLLVANGYARSYGMARRTPGGVERDETRQRLEDLEASAMLKRAGVWAKSDPDRIVALRAKRRERKRELEKPKEKAGDESQPPADRLDVNRASKEELMLIKGIGPVFAERIIAARPFKKIEHLTRVKGIGKKRLAALRKHLEVKNGE